MNKFDSPKLPTRIDPPSAGWLVQIYRGDRRLLCVLDASHAWTFLWGCGFGLLLAVGWFNFASQRPPTPAAPSTPPPVMGID